MLTPERIDKLAEHVRTNAEFARAIEAEVRKDDDALIRHMLESMCWAARVMTISEDEAPGYFAVISTARARLEEGGQ